MTFDLLTQQHRRQSISFLILNDNENVVGIRRNQYFLLPSAHPEIVL